MRKVLGISLGICLLWTIMAAHAFASEINAESRLSRVTVYPGSALLTRTATLDVSPGEQEIVFSDIIPNLDENTLKVSGLGSAKVKILGAELKKEFLKEKPAERVREIEKEIENLEIEKRKLADSHHILIQEREFLTSLRFFSQKQLPRDLITKVPATKDVADLLKFLDEDLKKNFAGALEIELKGREIDKQIDVLRRELGEIATPSKMKRSIIVDVEVLKAGSLEVNVSYLVYGASWNSIYDARAAFDKSEVGLTAYGIVRQTTGEDWQDVDITLSTAQPSRGGRLPDIFPWILRPYQPPVYASKAEMAARKAKSQIGQELVDAGRIRGFDEEKAMEAPAEAQMAYATAQERGASVVYKIPRKATIKTDGSEVRLPVFVQALEAKFKYSAYPKAVPLAYLASRVTNSKDLFLLAGRVNLFFEDDFVGASSIDNIAPQEPFDFYLGVDESVKIKREQLEKKVDDVLIGGIPSPNRRVTLKYKLTAENYKNKKIQMEFFESVPVSENERIKVKIDQVSLEPKERDFKDKKGVWRWEVELEPKAKKEIIYTVTIEYPRGMQIEGL